ncbi:hypothetical protein P0L94_04685 [Microbacter sp. GSS18]|nr:hypothetical protein P0L94_04685 [Microbacter sp. GSS18]
MQHGRLASHPDLRRSSVIRIVARTADMTDVVFTSPQGFGGADAR